MRRYYMVRAMLSEEEDFRIFFEESVVAVGWSEVNFSGYSNAEQVSEKVKEIYYEEGDKRVISKKLNEVKRFKNLQEGDIVIVPFYSSVVLAIVGKEEIYSEKAYERGLANQRKVEYCLEDGKLMLISRKELSEGLQRRLRVRGSSVSDLFEFADELESIFLKKETYSYTQEMKQAKEEYLKEIKKNLLGNIRKGKTYLQAGGQGLERLVCELMKCEGYIADLLSKNHFPKPADADIRAMKEDAFSSQKILVQVKHHDGYSGKEGIEQIIAALGQEGYEDYSGYFVTSGEIGEDVERFAEQSDIGLIDGNLLVDLIVEHLDQLPEELQDKLGVYLVPNIVSV